MNNFDDKHVEGNKNDSLYILYIDLTDQTFDECQELYKRRWMIETANKYRINRSVKYLTDIRSIDMFNKIYQTIRLI